MINASQLLHLCQTRDTRIARCLHELYGVETALVDERVRLLERVVSTYLKRYGDGPVRVFRCPGRVNLRGMHVDTHGGYLNLMTHQREVVIVLSPNDDPTYRVCNIEPEFEPVTFHGTQWHSVDTFRRDWHTFITDPAIQTPVLQRRGHWRNYLEGCAARVQQHWPDKRFTGFNAVVGSDLPRGAALSSSTALSMVFIKALTACNDCSVDDALLIRLGKEAEWYTGARGGMSDQAAMVLSNRGELVNIAIRPDDLDVSGARRIAFPEELDVLVIDSQTERSLSGAQLVEYTRNRFAYSLAMEILRQEFLEIGVDEVAVRGVHYLSDLGATHIDALGGARFLYDCLRHIPESIAIDALKDRYDLPQLDEVYEQYFGTAPAELRPQRIGLRGPLLFGIAESERARVFPDLLRDGAYDCAGGLMTLGHDGDRLFTAAGTPYRFDIGDEALERLAAESAPIENCPGVYGASSRALDTIVDMALAAGALGASLTGGGIAGTVLALCNRPDSERISEALQGLIESEDYGRLAGLTEPGRSDAVVVNRAVAPLGEIAFGDAL